MELMTLSLCELTHSLVPLVNRKIVLLLNGVSSILKATEQMGADDKFSHAKPSSLEF